MNIMYFKYYSLQCVRRERRGRRTSSSSKIESFREGSYDTCTRNCLTDSTDYQFCHLPFALSLSAATVSLLSVTVSSNVVHTFMFSDHLTIHPIMAFPLQITIILADGQTTKRSNPPTSKNKTIFSKPLRSTPACTSSITITIYF